MLANSEQTQPFTEIISKLKLHLDRSWLKHDKTSFNSASVAVTDNTLHYSGLVESRTHLLDVTSEHAVLALATAAKDPHIKEIVSMVQGNFELSPLIIKILADHTRRTGTPIKYTVFDIDGKELFTCDNASDLYYAPKTEILEKIKTWEPRKNKTTIDQSIPIEQQLRTYAEKGMQTHFSAGTKSLYGAAVIANGKIYYSGVYSSFDKRLNLHAEMVAAISAIMDGNREITHVGLISTKFEKEPCHMCGCCRQFFSEIQQKTGKEINIVAFSMNGKNSQHRLSEYLPYGWHSG
ncbi:hypothetical protein COV18_02415 [Candidatus Woesearchaeota archaeon CG10_big_fil_rev_8_21_14_0_10_37_12]|nr:MAG: hypothetical protein COV18_02415 [Candidatus Woesearchaeota archaeon CG10_big_fil_rev_8_21_14_0_10_37_12]